MAEGPGAGFAAAGGDLLAVARAAIAARLRSDAEASAPAAGLDAPRGAFVTLWIGHSLRGCIGYPLPVKPLAAAVHDAALAAAFDDPRFPPLAADELDRIRIEVSVLSVPEPCAPSDVVAGRHGVIVSRGDRRGLLLPQVAVEHGWDRETLLDQACRKAGLEAGAWRHGARVERFTATVFTEE